VGGMIRGLKQNVGKKKRLNFDFEKLLNDEQREAYAGLINCQFSAFTSISLYNESAVCE